jgi:hypothetical protein
VHGRDGREGEGGYLVGSQHALLEANFLEHLRELLAGQLIVRRTLLIPLGQQQKLQSPPSIHLQPSNSSSSQCRHIFTVVDSKMYTFFGLTYSLYRIRVVDMPDLRTIPKEWSETTYGHRLVQVHRFCAHAIERNRW